MSDNTTNCEQCGIKALENGVCSYCGAGTKKAPPPVPAKLTETHKPAPKAKH